MSIKYHNDKTGKWEIIASNKASDIAINDNGSNFNSNNVEGALKEVGGLVKANDIKLSEIDGRVQYIEEHGTTGGGGSGGGALPTITSEYNATIIDASEEQIIKIFFSSPNLGSGTCYIVCNDIELLTVPVDQGYNNVTIPALGSGTFKLSLYVKDRAGLLSNTLNWDLTAGGLIATLTMNTNLDYSITDRILMTYNVEYSLDDEITMYLTVDYDDYTVTCSKGYNSYNLTGLGVGIHKVSFYLKAGPYSTKVQAFNVVVVNTEDLYVSSTTDSKLSIEEGDPLSINYRISKKSTEYFDVQISIDNKLVSRRQSIVGNYYYNNNTLPVGTHVIKISVTSESGESSELVFNVEITAGSYIRKQIVTGGLIANWDATGLSNQDANKTKWIDKVSGIEGELYNFNYSSNGWITDNDTNETYLACNGNTYVKIPYAPFANNVTTGFTIDILFRTRDVGDIDARVLDITDTLAPYKGVYIDTQNAHLISAIHDINAAVGDNEWTRVTYVIDRLNKFGKIYINAILSSAFYLTDDSSGSSIRYEDFMHNEYIYLNSFKGTGHYGSCEIRCLRLYERELNDKEVLQNHIADIVNTAEQKAKYDFNYNNNGIPKMYLWGDTTEMSLTQKKTMRIKYVSPNNEEYGESFDYPYCKVYWQGTSSLTYIRKNYNIELFDEDQRAIKYTPFKTGKAENVLCLKVNYMEHSNVNNVGLAEFANNGLYSKKNPAQELDPDIRQTITGFPILVFINDDCMGLYDFNLDRYSTNSFGYNLIDETLAYEVSANTDATAGAFNKWTSASGQGKIDYYAADFEVIYPPSKMNGNDDYADLITLIEFVSDADDELFKAKFDEYFDRESVFRYLLFVLVFGMVDSLGKNMKLVTFDRKKWYIQLYDLDTAMGLDNTGALTFDVDIEIEKGTFNTSTSQLWTKILRVFEAELKQEYANMRNEQFTLKNIMHYIYDEQMSKIPEVYYNESAQVRYLDFGGKFLYALHGSRENQIKRWIRERLLYVDTLLGYDASTADYITVRGDMDGFVHLDIQTYSPMYLTVKWRDQANNSGSQILKIKRGETIRFEKELHATDQEILIYGGQHLKSIGDVSNTSPKHLLLSAAPNLIDLRCTADTLFNVSLNTCKMMQTVDLHGCSRLGVDASNAVLDLSGCENLRTVDIRGTKITSVTTSIKGGNLESIYYPYSIQAIELYNQTNLLTLSLPTSVVFNERPDHELNKLPSKLSTFIINNCPNLKTIRYEESEYDYYKDSMFLPLFYANNVEITNSFNDINTFDFSYCMNLKSLKLSNLDGLKTLKFNNLVYNGNSYSKLADIDFSKLDNLETIEMKITDESIGEYTAKPAFAQNTTLDLSKCINLKNILCNYAIHGLSELKLPTSIDKLVFDNTFDKTYSDINKIYISSIVGAMNTIDLSGSKLHEFNIKTINKIKAITNLYLYTYHKEDVDINKYRDNIEIPYATVQGVYDFTNYADSDFSNLFKDKDLTNIKLVSSEYLPLVVNLESCFERSTVSSDTGLDAFFTKLTGVTNIKNLFKNSVGLTNGVSMDTSKVINAYGAYYGCSDLVSIPEYNLESAIDISYMFYKCSSLADIFTFNVPKCISANYAFYDCKSLVELMFSSDNKISSATHMCDNCSSLERVTLFNTATLAYMSYMFYQCKMLSAYPDIDTTALKDVNYAFYNCIAMQGTPDGAGLWNNSNIKNYSLCFAGCINLTNFYTEIPVEWGGGMEEIGVNDLEFSIIPTTNQTDIIGDYLPTFYSTYNHNMVNQCSSAWTEHVAKTSIKLKEPIAVTAGETYNLTQTTYGTIRVVACDASGNIRTDIIRNSYFQNKEFTVPAGVDYINVIYSSYGDKYIARTANLSILKKNAQNVESGYTNIIITKTDGTITESLNTTINEVSKVYIKFNPDTTYISFRNHDFLQSVSSIDLSNCPVCDYMFLNCPNLVSVGSLTTEGVLSMDSMFYGCTKLSEISSIDLSTCTNISRMFYGCTKLTDLSSIDLSKILYIEEAFTNCISLAEINIKNLVNVLSLYKTFYGCTALTSIPQLNISNCDSLEYAFYNCKNLTRIAGINTDTLKYMSYAFYNCNSLQNIPTFDTSKVTNMDYSFYGCETIVSIPAFSTSNVLTMNYTFAKCTSLIEIPIFDYIGLVTVQNTFENCQSLTSITMANTNNLTSIPNIFYNCLALISIDGLDTTNVTDMSYAFYNCASLTGIELNVKSVTSMAYTFYGCTKLKSVLFTDNSTTTACTTFLHAFDGCQSLESIGSLDTSACEDITYIFNNCLVLNTIGLASWDISKITSLNHSFTNCKALSKQKETEGADPTDLNALLSWDVSKIVSFNSTFKGWDCINLDLSNWTTSAATKMDYMFEDCKNLQTIIGIDSFVMNTVTSITCMFRGCSSMTSLNLNTWNTVLLEDASNAFESCSSLETLEIGNWNASNIQSLYSFLSDCTALKQLDISSWELTSITNLERMCYACESMTDFNINTTYIKDNVISSMSYMLYQCTSLNNIPTDFYIKGAANYVFALCSALTHIKNVYVLNSTSSYQLFRGCSALDTVDKIVFTNCNNISNLFMGCLSLTTINTFTVTNTAGNTNMQNVFNDCAKLTTLNNSSIDSSVYTLYYCFNGCIALVDLDLTNWNITNCENLAYTFNNCQALKTITVGANWNTSKVKNFNSAFSGCLELLVVPALDLSSATDMTGMCNGCKKMTKIDGMETTTYNSSKVINIQYAFYDCQNLLYLPVLTTTSVSNASYTFFNCISMTGEPLSGSYWNSSIPSYSYCFYNCKALDNYPAIPDRWKGIGMTTYGLRMARAVVPQNTNEVVALQEEILEKQNELNMLINQMNSLLSE